MTLFYEDVIGALTTAGVRFVVVGGLAVILHGVPRTTSDLDLAVDLDEVDVLIDSPVDFARLARNTERLQAEHLVVPIAGAADLIEMKQAAGREQDLADADALRRLLEDRDRG